MALKEEQQRHADAALASPSEPTEFEYGRVCGIYAGLGRAWQIVNEVVGEDDDRNDRL